MSDYSPSMMRHHGLEHILADLLGAGNSASLELSVCQPLAQINLRGNQRDERFVSAVSAVLQQELPSAANTFSEGRQRIYWLGPNEWLISSDDESAATILTRLRVALGDIGAAVTDVTAGQACLRLRGQRATQVLAKGCTLDLYPGVFKVGDCAQTGLGKAAVLIALRNDEPLFEILVRRSYADYVLRWLCHAGREFGMPAGDSG